MPCSTNDVGLCGMGWGIEVDEVDEVDGRAAASFLDLCMDVSMWVP